MGAAIVTAYHAERSSAAGLRIFIHPHVLRRNTEPFIRVYPIALATEAVTDAAAHELRFWQPIEAQAATDRLCAFRDKQQLTDRARQHYDATLMAYERFRTTEIKPIPFVLPAIWL